MNNDSAFPHIFRNWDSDEKEYYTDSTEGLTKLGLISAILLNGRLSQSHVGLDIEDAVITNTIRLAKKLLNKLQE